jgi:toxin ParE1/3/4
VIFELSQRARSDVKNIIRYTLDNFGSAKTDEYLDGLYNTFELLTENPKLGREWTRGRRRCVYRSHYVYYRVAGDRIFITQIRHSRQKPI